MKRKFLVLTIVFYCLFFGSKISAQAYKSENINFNTYIFPTSYIPKDYYNYGVKINLSENPISVIIDGEKKSSRPPLTYHAGDFFSEKELIRLIVGTEDEEKIKIGFVPTILEFGHTNQPIEAKDHFIIDVSYKNVVYGADISENKSLETPFTYTVYYSYDTVIKIINSYSKQVVMEKKDTTYKKMISYSFEGYIPGFKTKPEAVNYLIANIDKGFTNDVVNDIKQYLRPTLDFWLDVQYIQDRCFFSRISKEDKNPLFLKLNQDVDAIEKWSRQKTEPMFDDAFLSANAEFIQKNNLESNTDQSRYFHDKTRLLNYKNFLDDKKVLTDFILKMNQYTKQFDANDKGQKVALWACYVNIASGFSVLGNYKSSLEYIQKARLLDYQERQVKNIEDKVIERQKNHNIFVDANGEIKKDVNDLYLKYFKL
ncbi:hypothetical protein [Flavobacterium pectinovorum]|uniref:hypothetical protein n=1 Tax=Flavobacterium pectinovorum TaxID=29533 RepID=UPI001FACAEE8|nr:hypothetical protein [Flavobacterium pectinovorum]MCI9843756.1 hypothetical protein [Flavobacterium pectinovorum]